MRFRFIEDRRADYPVTLLCDVLGVSPAGYYAWRSRPESRRSAANRDLVDDIRRVHRDTRGRYGSPRIHVELMQSAGLRASMSRKGDCYDNAPMDSFFHTLKTELVHRRHYATRAKLLGNRSDRAPTRGYQINRLPLVVVRKRPTLTSFHPTPPGSSSLLEVSINSEEVHGAAAGLDWVW